MTAAPRGSPSSTLDRLVESAAREFAEHGYFATDTNRIAKRAGYAPATFYKHFADKKTVFLAVHETWVSFEWSEIDEIFQIASPAKRANAIVDFLIRYHRKWRVLRASLRALVALEPDVRRFHRAQRAKQRKTLGDHVSDATPTASSRAAVGLLILIAERLCDAIADGELESLSLTEEQARSALVERFYALFLGPVPHSKRAANGKRKKK